MQEIRDRGVGRRPGPLIRWQLSDDSERAAAVARQRRKHRCPEMVASGGEIRRLVTEMDKLRRARPRVDPGHATAHAVRDPDGTAGVHDVGGRAADLGRSHLPGPRIEAREGAAGSGDPDAARADGHRRPGPGRSRSPGTAGRPLDRRAAARRSPGWSPRPRQRRRDAGRGTAERMVATTSPVPASILDSESLVSLATQTDPYPKAITSGPIPTWIVATCRPAPGLTSETVSSSSLATHTSPPPTVTPAGPRPTGMRSMTCPAESTRSRRSSALSVTQTDPAP